MPKPLFRMELINETKSAEAKARLESPGRAKARQRSHHFTTTNNQQLTSTTKHQNHHHLLYPGTTLPLLFPLYHTQCAYIGIALCAPFVRLHTSARRSNLFYRRSRFGSRVWILVALLFEVLGFLSHLHCTCSLYPFASVLHALTASSSTPSLFLYIYPLPQQSCRSTRPRSRTTRKLPLPTPLPTFASLRNLAAEALKNCSREN